MSRERSGIMQVSLAWAEFLYMFLRLILICLLIELSAVTFVAGCRKREIAAPDRTPIAEACSPLH
jgi:hypothetical protein